MLKPLHHLFQNQWVIRLLFHLPTKEGGENLPKLEKGDISKLGVHQIYFSNEITFQL